MYDPVEAARGLRGRITEAAPLIEHERQLPGSLVDEMREAGLFHMTIPQSLGGLEANPVAAARAVEEIAYADGSAAVCVMLAAQSTGLRRPAARGGGAHRLRKRRYHGRHRPADWTCHSHARSSRRLPRLRALAVRERVKPRDLVPRGVHHLRWRTATRR